MISALRVDGVADVEDLAEHARPLLRLRAAVADHALTEGLDACDEVREVLGALALRLLASQGRVQGAGSGARHRGFLLWWWGVEIETTRPPWAVNPRGPCTCSRYCVPLPRLVRRAGGAGGGVVGRGGSGAVRASRCSYSSRARALSAFARAIDRRASVSRSATPTTAQTTSSARKNADTGFAAAKSRTLTVAYPADPAAPTPRATTRPPGSGSHRRGSPTRRPTAATARTPRGSPTRSPGSAPAARRPGPARSHAVPAVTGERVEQRPEVRLRRLRVVQPEQVEPLRSRHPTRLPGRRLRPALRRRRHLLRGHRSAPVHRREGGRGRCCCSDPGRGSLSEQGRESLGSSVAARSARVGRWGLLPLRVERHRFPVSLVLLLSWGWHWWCPP